MPDRVIEAHARLPHLPLVCADGQNLPYRNDQFDLIIQYTAFSSILDHQIKIPIAQEMVRVVHKKGLILWYDFWLNPTHPHTKGIRLNEIKHLFPGCTYHVALRWPPHWHAVWCLSPGEPRLCSKS